MDTNRAGDGWSALADGTRRAIVSRLADGPQAVGQLAAGLPVSRSAVSQHLKVLKDAGLVTDTREGTRRLYQLNPEGVARLRAHFDQMWTQAMSAFQAVAEKSPKEQSPHQPPQKKKTPVKGERNAHVRRRSRRP